MKNISRQEGRKKIFWKFWYEECIVCIWIMKSISCQEEQLSFDPKECKIFASEPWKALVAKRGGQSFNKRNIWVMKTISCLEETEKIDQRNVDFCIWVMEPWKALVVKREAFVAKEEKVWSKECNICIWIMKSNSGQEGGKLRQHECIICIQVMKIICWQQRRAETTVQKLRFRNGSRMKSTSYQEKR